MINIKSYSKNKENVSSSTTTSSSGSGTINTTNADTANKLAETHTIFGQPFNGTQDVKGNLSDVNNITATGTVSCDSVNATTEVVSAKGSFENLISSVLFQSDGTSIFNSTATFNSSSTFNGTSTFNGKSTFNDDATFKNISSENITNSDTITTKNLEVSGTAHFFELIIDKIKAAGGAVLFTPADGFEVDMVETTSDYVKLYWKAADEDGNARDNMWQIGDQAICQSFNQAKIGTSYNVSNKYYWALVIDVSSEPEEDQDEEGYFHWIKLSPTTFVGTLNPEKGDSIAMLGHRITTPTDYDGDGEVLDSAINRQSAIYISTYTSLDSGITAPLLAQYRGIDDFDLSSHRKSYFDANGAKFIGNFEISGKTPEDYIQDVVNNTEFESHSPYIGDDGYWYYWDSSSSAYINSNIKAQGNNGSSLYTWIKYADDANGTNMSDSPDGKSYIGLAFNKESSTESTTASDYTWSLFKASSGENGKYKEFLFQKATSTPDKPTISKYSEISSSNWSTIIPTLTGTWTDRSDTNYSISGTGVETTLDSISVRQLPGNSVSNAFVSDTITINTTHYIEKISINIFSSSEDNYDYIAVGLADTKYTSSNTTYTTAKSGDLSSRSASGLSSSWITITTELTGIGKHTIQVMYLKDGTGNYNSDCGYYYISANQYYDTPEKIYYSTNDATYSGSEWIYNSSDWTTPQIWNEKGDTGATGANGENAVYYKLFPIVENALVDSEENLNLQFTYIIYQVVGDNQTQISASTTGYYIRFKPNTSSSYTMLSYSSEPTYSGTYQTKYYSTNEGSLIYFTVELYDSVNSTVLDSRIVSVGVVPSLTFKIDSDLKTITSTIQDSETGLAATYTKATQAKQTADGFETRVSATEAKLDGTQTSELLTQINSVKSTAEGTQSTVSRLAYTGTRLNLLPDTSLTGRNISMYYAAGVDGNYVLKNKGYQGMNCFRAYIPQSSTTYYYGLHWGGSNKKSIKLDTTKTYTLSVWCKANTENSRLIFEVHKVNKLYGTRQSGYSQSKTTVISEVDTWKQYIYEFTPKGDYNEIFIFTYNSSSDTDDADILICMPMLAEGKITQWTLSPEDDFTLTYGNMLSNTGELTVLDNLESSVYTNTGTFPNTKNKYLYGYNSSNQDLVQWLLTSGTIQSNQDYIFSFWAKTDTDGNYLYSYMYYEGGGPVILAENSNGSDYNQTYSYDSSSEVAGDGYNLVYLSTEWRRYWVHWHTSINGVSDKDIHILLRQPANQQVYIAQPKLELGVNSTDYTVSNTDFATQYNVQSQISQSADSINLSINNLTTGLETCGIHLSDGTISMNGSVEITEGNSVRVINSSDQVKAVISPNTIGTLSSLPTGQNGTVNYTWSVNSSGNNSGSTISSYTKSFVLGTIETSGDSLTLGTITLKCKLLGTNYTISAGTETTGSVNGTLSLLRDSTTLQSWSVSESASFTKTCSLSTSSFTTTGTYILQFKLNYSSATNYNYTMNNMSASLNVVQVQTGSAYTAIGSDGFFSTQGTNKYLYAGSDGIIMRWEGDAMKLGSNGLQRMCYGNSTTTNSNLVWGTMLRRNVQVFTSSVYVSSYRNVDMFIFNSSSNTYLYLDTNVCVGHTVVVKQIGSGGMYAYPSGCYILEDDQGIADKDNSAFSIGNKQSTFTYIGLVGGYYIWLRGNITND